MLIRQLEYLLALTREQHFGRAAVAAGISQPALSEAIRRLEEELGVPVVRRGRTYGGLTAEGELVVAWAQRILDDRDRLHDELLGLRGTVAGRVRVGAIPAAMRAAAELAARVGARHPALAVELRSLSSREIARRLAAHELDAGITYLDNEPLADVRATPLVRERFVLALGVDADRPATITWAEAGRLPLCLMTRDMQNRRIVDGAFARAGVVPTSQIEADSVPALLDLVASGPWASVIAEAWAVGDARIATVPLVDPVVEHEIGVVVPDRDPLPIATRALIAAAGGEDA